MHKSSLQLPFQKKNPQKQMSQFEIGEEFSH